MNALFRGFCPNENGKQIAVVNGEKHKGDWVEGTPIFPKGYNKAIITTGELAVSDMPNFGFVQFEVLPETVSQWTGLEDKNGKKIFENDKFDKYNFVEFCNGAFCVNGDSPLCFWKKKEVIGTVFDKEEYEQVR